MVLTTFSAIILVAIFVIILMAVGIYNRLISLRNRFKNAWSQIDVQLKRRYDLIPNLVESARAFMSHERETLEAVIQARNQALSAGARAAEHPDMGTNISQLAQAESILGSSLGRLFALAESYPELKANQNIATLMEELSSTENKIAFARQAFNDSVMTYNTVRESFPTILFANFFQFKSAEPFEISKIEEREAPQVNFSKRS